MKGHLRIEAAGLFTTVQDLGRFGAQALGIPAAGALDPIGLRLANALVGNPQGTGGLEIRFLGPTIRVMADQVRVALAGTSAGLEILAPERRAVPPGQSVTLVRDQRFRVGAIADTSCCYLAVAGGFDLADVLGSVSTYTPGAFGGFEGRALKDGDAVSLKHGTPPPGRNLGLRHPFDYKPSDPVRVVPGPQADYFTASGWSSFCDTPYTVSKDANRMGLRLEGAKIDHRKGFNIPSDGIVTGSIQVPGTGQPIVLLADRQTTGGYPKIATVISADLPRLGRMRPGDTVRFQKVGADEAEDIRREQEIRLQAEVENLRPLPEDQAQLEYALFHENLISGVTSATENPD